ncbi:MAG: carboxymuconolactone decarboxylase family protein [Chitinophagaceae bacterium]|nr:carboxymuconolactone decarboxylase family protein [Chitinophagaceae bacterium]
MDHDSLYPLADVENSKKRAELAPGIIDTWRQFSRSVYQEGALDEKTKQLIAVAVAHVTQCPYCIRAHTRIAMRKGATKQEIMEAVWVAAEMRAGAGYSHSIIAMDEMEKVESSSK